MMDAQLKSQKAAKAHDVDRAFHARVDRGLRGGALSSSSTTCPPTSTWASPSRDAAIRPSFASQMPPRRRRSDDQEGPARSRGSHRGFRQRSSTISSPPTFRCRMPATPGSSCYFAHAVSPAARCPGSPGLCSLMRPVRPAGRRSGCCGTSARQAASAKRGARDLLEPRRDPLGRRGGPLLLQARPARTTRRDGPATAPAVLEAEFVERLAQGRRASSSSTSSASSTRSRRRSRTPRTNGPNGQPADPGRDA